MYGPTPFRFQCGRTGDGGLICPALYSRLRAAGAKSFGVKNFSYFQQSPMMICCSVLVKGHTECHGFDPGLKSEAFQERA